MLKVKTLLLAKLLLVMLAALVIGYWSGVAEWQEYERFADLSFAEARAVAMQRFEKPEEPAPIRLTMLSAVGIMVVVVLAYEAVSFMLEGLISRVRKRSGA